MYATFFCDPEWFRSKYYTGEVSLVEPLAGVFGVVEEQLAGSELITISFLKALHFLDKFVSSV